MIASNNTHFVNALKQLSAKDWADFGVNDLAYLKPVTLEGELQYAIHAANGEPLAVMDTKSTAHAAVLQNDLEPVSVH
jgi:hypothetical protein